MIFAVRSDPGCQDGSLAFNLVQRKTLALSLNEPLAVEAWFAPKDNIHVTRIAMEADFPSKARATSDAIDAVELAKHCAVFFQGQVLSVTQDILVDFQGNSLTLRVTELEVAKGPIEPADLAALPDDQAPLLPAPPLPAPPRASLSAAPAPPAPPPVLTGHASSFPPY
jgi:hypothetical protein